MRKIIVIFVVILLTTCGIFYSVAAFSVDKNLQLNEKTVFATIKDPLTLRAEVKVISESKVLLSAYATNTWDEQIKVYWSNKPCLFTVFYFVPNEEDLALLVFYPYHKNIYNFVPSTIIEFESGEEKLIQKTVFFGISNWILPGLSRGYKNYIPSFPWLPNGDYEFSVTINAYFVNNEYPQYTDWIHETVFFYFGA